MNTSALGGLDDGHVQQSNVRTFTWARRGDVMELAHNLLRMFQHQVTDWQFSGKRPLLKFCRSAESKATGDTS
jgi:hypothetical protein